MKIFSLLLIVFSVLFWSLTMATNYSQELQDAYNFAYQNKITTMDSIDKADMNWWLTRIAMAKMLSQYAINVLWKKPDISRQTIFIDVSKNLDNDYNNGVTLAYQLWIMWIWINEFRPFDNVTRAEFWTALSRVLYWDKYEWWSHYYTNHLNALKSAGIMTQIVNAESTKEIRGWVMLMLMRSGEWGVVVDCEDPAIALACEMDNSECPSECWGAKNKTFNNVENTVSINKSKVSNIEKIYWNKKKNIGKIKVYYSDWTNIESEYINAKYRIVIHKYWSITDYENYCVVEFKDYNGTILKNDEIRWEWTEFSEIEKPTNPTRPSDGNCTYTFSWWSNAFTISWNYNNTTISKMSNRLDGLVALWALISNCEHKAEYTCVPKTYTVTRKDADWSILQENNNLEYGDAVPQYKGKIPKKNGYDFIWWQWWKWEFSVWKNISYNAIFGDKWVKITPIPPEWYYCVDRNMNRLSCILEYSWTTYLHLPWEVIKDWWYFIWWNETTSDNSNADKEDEKDISNNNNLSSNNDNSNEEDSLNNENNNSEGSNNSTNSSSNCVNMEVDSWNLYDFCIKKLESNKFSMSVTNAEEIYGCSITKISPNGGSNSNWVFNNCWTTGSSEFTVLPASWEAKLLLKFSHNGKAYNKYAYYDLTNWVFL